MTHASPVWIATADGWAESALQTEGATLSKGFCLIDRLLDSPANAAHALELLCVDLLVVPTADGMLVIDDTVYRNDGRAADHVVRRSFGSVGKLDNSIVAHTTLCGSDINSYLSGVNIPSLDILLKMLKEMTLGSAEQAANF